MLCSCTCTPAKVCKEVHSIIACNDRKTETIQTSLKEEKVNTLWSIYTVEIPSTENQGTTAMKNNKDENMKT